MDRITPSADDEAPDESADEPRTTSRRRAVLHALVRISPVLLVLLLGVGGKLASIDALREIERLGQAERLVTRLEVSLLRLALESRRGEGAALPPIHMPAVARHVAEIEASGIAERLIDDPLAAAALEQLLLAAAPARLRALSEAAAGTSRDAAISGIDTLALLAAGAADAVQASVATEAEGLWQRVWALGGGAVAGLLLTALGGSTLAALALARVQAILARIEDYARRLKRADAEKADAVAAAELAAVARTERLMSETLARLEEARSLAEQARSAAEGDLGSSRGSAEAARQMLRSLGEAVEAPMGRIRALSASLRIGHVVTEADRATLDEIETDGEALHRLAEGALDLIRLETGQDALDHRPFRPEMVLEAVRAELDPMARRRGTSLRVSIGAGCTEAYRGDARRVQALLTALLRHLLAGRANGTVTLEQHDEPGALVLTVACSGAAPMPAVDGAATDPGLSLVRALVARMEGRIAAGPAQADEGGGHCLRVRLPLSPISALTVVEGGAHRNRA